jgi:hypothetical protein
MQLTHSRSNALRKYFALPAALAAILGGVAAIPVGAQASAITECANFVPTGWSASQNIWRGYWTFNTFAGSTPVTNLTTRNVRCSYARPFSLAVAAKSSRHHNGFTCRWRHAGEEYDVRCTKGAQVIHWQGGD